MARFFLDPDAWNAAPELTGEEAVHCVRVLRAKVGDRIHVFDGRGRSAPAEIVALSKQAVRLKLGEVAIEPEAAISLTLAQAVIKGKGMEWLIQKAVELGVDQIQPLATRHAVVKPGDDKPEKWRRIALEACKQCGRSRLPVIHDTVRFSEWVSMDGGDLRCVAALFGEPRPFHSVLEQAGAIRSATFLVGPEGDFSADEMDDAMRSGWVPVTLGATVLRSETAALYGASVFRYFSQSINYKSD
ncbi:16S rRNA (uracil1498-N3)-methyltransferase [Haloferula luteola]|uniref:Ribosomal RNA small subunit methyltransferase E n=1 Tax=Haloferula luteola TaxID=595692 RepID=A0A840V988_9BACT|nr:RsmE family RNA methyltransferase [Haloferula luteola]MBB5350520.1 16S rRNA (uracil1498-N3)-methyltransferase [Haloferula luteola]